MDGLLSLIARFVAEILLEMLFAAILFWIGWPIVKVLTLGRYPCGQKCLDDTPQANWARATAIAALTLSYGCTRAISSLTHYKKVPS
jgi:hypothetical protein